jgi:GWxTD domain-containing protein
MSRLRPLFSAKDDSPAGRLFLVALLFLAVVGGACRLYKLERRLGEPYTDFISKVRYIMTSEERRVFLETPDSGKDAFIEEFWARRDPFPDTPRNEYKEEYEARVKRAGELFHGEGRPGWLTDRGRIHILFGPPFERLIYPMDASGYCREVWYYGSFPVLFVDEHCSGQYLLMAVNLEHLQALNIAQGHFQRPAQDQRKPFDYEVELRKVRDSETVYEAAVILSIPYERILFVFRSEKFEAAFDVRLELRSPSDELLLETRQSFSLTVDQDDLVSFRGKIYRMEIPLVLEAELGRLREEKLALDIFVRANAEREEVRKTVEFRLEF